MTPCTDQALLFLLGIFKPVWVCLSFCLIEIFASGLLLVYLYGMSFYSVGFLFGKLGLLGSLQIPYLEDVRYCLMRHLVANGFRF